MKKQIITILGLCLLAVALPAQIKLNVVGDAQIQGLLKLILGEDNVVVGANAGSALSTGADNTFVGEKAGNLNSTGSDNTFLGNDAGRNTTEGLSNVFVGGDTGESNSTGSANTFVGREAGFSNTSGSAGVGVGAGALYNNIDRSGLVAVGDSALFYNGIGAVNFEATRNTAVGSKALFFNSIGANNTAQGAGALFSNTTGNNNTAVGESTLGSNTEGSHNTATGVGALYANTMGNNNTAAGSEAMNANISGNDNTAYGTAALRSNTIGNRNVANGYEALSANTSGQRNVAVGAYALGSNTTASGSIAIGASALYNNTDRDDLVAIGTLALNKNGVGATEFVEATRNTAVGAYAMGSNTTGANNTANGYLALHANTFGGQNTANGVLALWSNITGSQNTANGYQANVSVGDLNHAAAIGADALTNANEKTVIGRNQPGVVIGGYADWSNLSDGRFKEDVKENVPGLEFISRLRPVTYWINLDKLQRHITAQMPDTIAARYLPDGEAMAKARQEIRTGFVAQEVEATAREIGYRFSGVNAPKNPTDNYSIAYSQFVPSLVKATQEQEEEIKAQDRKITGLQEENRRLRSELDEIKQLLNRLLEAGGQSATDQTIQLGSARLLQNSPNPFSEATTIAYFVPEGTAKAQLRITDMAGRVLRLETITGQGEGRLQLQAHSLAAGTYAYSLLVDGQVVETRQMVITK